MPTALEAIALTKDYIEPLGKRKRALDDVSFSISTGEVFGFVGPNGAGKSTAIRILTGLQTPSSGHAQVFGSEASDPKSRLRVGYVPENPYLYEYLTPLEILKMAVRLHRLDALATKELTRHCMKWLEVFQLDGVANKQVRTFSKGMTQRTALASALAIQPRLLILDEPLSGLDPIGRKQVVEILADYAKQGGTLFFSSHVLYDVERLADRFGLIHKGKLRTVCRPDEVLDQDHIYTKVIFTGAVLDKSVLLDSKRASIEIPRSELWSALDAIRNSGGSVLEIQRAAPLESLFFSLISE